RHTRFSRDWSSDVCSSDLFSTAICDATGEMVGQGVTLPNQLGAIPDAVASIFRTFPDDLDPGDIIILNDPFAGGTHLPDIYVIRSEERRVGEELVRRETRW